MKCALTYWDIIAPLHNHSHAFTVLPGNDASLQHSRRLSCKARLVLLAPRTDRSSMFDKMLHVQCVGKEQSIPPVKYFRCESVSLQVCKSASLRVRSP